MIPWTVFYDRTEEGLDSQITVDLEEHWLRWVEDGPSMKTFFLESPMLELAHERRFVVTQQGGICSDFVDEHPKRIDQCLSILSQNFDECTSNVEHFRSENIPTVEDVGLWQLDQSFTLPIKLELDGNNSISDEIISSSDPFDSLPMTRRCLVSDRTKAPGLASPIDIEDEGTEQTALLWRLLHQNIPRAGRGRYTQNTRARRPVRVRKRTINKSRRNSFVGIDTSYAFKPLTKDAIATPNGSAPLSSPETSNTSAGSAECNAHDALKLTPVTEIKMSDMMDTG